jgi:hypothetical protein
MTARRAWAAALLLLPLACTTAPDQHQFLPPTGTAGSSGGQPSGMPVVMITAPSNPTSVSVNSDVVVSANVSIQNGTDFIDTSSVAMTLAPAGSSANVASGLLISNGADSYAGTLSLGNVPAGTYTLTVSAKASSGMQASDQISLTIDAGPIITILSPVADHGYKGSLAIDLTVDPGANPLMSGPTAMIGGMAVPLTMPDPTGSDYRATVVFGPTKNLPPGAVQLPALSGRQLLDVQATNSMGVKAEARVTFVIDTSGPTITSTTPRSSDVVGGVVNISATVTDDSGVLDSSVVAVISDHETPIFELALTPQGSGIYGVLFDSANLTACPEPPATGLCLVFPTISFRAVDLVGNQTIVSYGFGVDNIAPIADLDPPLMRQMSLQMDGLECSFAFDPLSVNRNPGDMPNDLCTVPQVFDLRARIEDDGNRADEVKAVPISLVDPINTNVFIMPAARTQEPLVVDSDGDGRCDEVNPRLLPTSPTVPPTVASGILQIRLAPVPPQGRGDFRPDPSLPSNAPCIEGSSKAPPKLLCNTFEQPTIAIGYSDSQPAIWSVEPIDNSFHCLGNQVDTFANGIAEGWACVAVQTRDKAGNQSVSVPMRVYVKYDTPSFCLPPPASAGPPPNCTGKYDPVSNTAVLGSCTSRSFPDTLTYYCVAGDC